MIAEIIDSEGSILPNIHPWNTGSYLSSWCMEQAEPGKDAEHLQDTSEVWLFNHVSEKIRDHATMLKEIQHRIDACDLLVFHNAKHDLHWMIACGLKFDHKPVWCTLLGDYVLYGQDRDISYSLNSCAARRELGTKVDLMAQFWAEGIETNEIPFDIHNKYVRQDVHLTKQLFLRQFEELKLAQLENTAYVSFELTKMVARMEYDGLKFDVEKAKQFAEEAKETSSTYELELKKIARLDFNPGSSDQLRSVMFGGPIKRTVQEIVAKQRKNGTFRVYTRKAEYKQDLRGLGLVPHESTISDKTMAYSVGKDAQALLRPTDDRQREFLKALREYSKARKVVSTLVGDGKKSGGLISKVQSDGRLHPTFNQFRTRTGRFASSDPNAQNFPRGSTSPIKKAIVSENGLIINGDLSQIEWRIAASLSKDEVMMDELWHGFDAHADRARRSFCEPGVDETSKEFKAGRQSSKTFNFRMIYGGTAEAFYYDGEMPDFDLEVYEHIVQDFYDKYKGLREWQLSNHKLANKQWYLRNDTGRILTFPIQVSKRGKKYIGLTKVCNYPVQSGAFDCMAVAMLVIYKRFIELGLKSKIIMQVHDSLVFDAYPEEAYTITKLCADVMCAIPELVQQYYGYQILVPITCEVALSKTYGDKGPEFKAQDINEESINAAVKEILNEIA